MPPVQLIIDTTPLVRFSRLINLDREQSPIMRRMFDRVGAAYAAFVQRRFVAFSRGGGGWPALAPSTVRARRRGRGAGHPAILRDTGLLFMALAIGGSGNYYRPTKRGIVYGFGDSPHPRPHVQRVRGRSGRSRLRRFIGAAGTATLRQIAGYHNDGGIRPGRPPRRLILARPNEQTKEQFAGFVRRAVAEAGRAAGSGAGVLRRSVS